jgi:WD40 repeat protein
VISGHARPSDSKIYVWDAASGKNIAAVEGGGLLALSPNGKVLASSSGFTITLWDVEHGKNAEK